MTHDTAHQLLDFIDQSPTAFHAVNTTALALQKAGFVALDERQSWPLQPGDKRFVTRNDSAIIAFIVGSQRVEVSGIRMAGAHTDSPHLKVKPIPEVARNGYRQLSVELYGGLLLTTWLDRDLTLAGRVVIELEGKLISRLIHFGRPLLRIPNLAIHLDREVNNKGLLLNAQQHLFPILGLNTEGWEEKGLRKLLAKELSSMGTSTVNANDIVEFDLAVVDTQRSTVAGDDDCFIFAPRIDNLASCHALLVGLLGSADINVDATRMIALWDNEECGSRSAQGAQGSFLRSVVHRIVESLGSDSFEALAQTLSQSFLISSDMAHAVHPNYADRHDAKHSPTLGKGPVIKFNANHSYASDAESAARFTALCRAENVEPQRFAMRSDLPCGSTIGPITEALEGIKTVDIGNPMLSMHSIREMASVEDHATLIRVLDRYFRNGG